MVISVSPLVEAIHEKVRDGSMLKKSAILFLVIGIIVKATFSEPKSSTKILPLCRPSSGNIPTVTFPLEWLIK